MNVNAARFHLLLGRADWGRCLDRDDATALDLASWWSAHASPLLQSPKTLPAWDEVRNELTLQPVPISLPATQGEQPLVLDARRGAAADRHGNVYRIADDRRQLLVSSAGSGNESAFWPAAPADCESEHLARRSPFETQARPLPVVPEAYLAMAVTADDYLVVAFGRGALRGLLSFDLIAGGSPIETVWPAGGFEPFDMCARAGGGVWVLDRTNKRLWELDCKLAVVTTGQAEQTLAPAVVDDFQPLTGPARERTATIFPAGFALGGSPALTINPIAIESTTQGSVLLLDIDAANQRSRVLRLRREGDTWRTDVSDWLDKMQAHDFVYAATPRFQNDAPHVRLFIAATVGNQAHAFDIVDKAESFGLRIAPELYPLRRYAGRALLAVRYCASYDSGFDRPRWTQVVQQPRLRFEGEAVFVTPVLDSAELGTTWDKLLFDACIPADTAVEIESRAGDERDDLVDAADSPPSNGHVIANWSPEPSPRLRSDGSELPWLRSVAARATRRQSGIGTWELLLQRAQGRYLQLRVRLVSHNGTGTPRLRAMRVWSPRFSYSERFLPAVYREEPSQANFLERWLSNFESTLTQLEDRIVNVQSLLDARTVPADALAWLAEWFDVALDPAWDERRHRLFVRHAMDFFRWRGTTHGLRLALELAFDPRFDAAMFGGPRSQDDGARRIRIVEAYQTRLVGAVVAGDPASAEGEGPRQVLLEALWTPKEGNAGLAHRFAASQKRDATPVEQITAFPLVAPPPDPNADAETNAKTQQDWRKFCTSALGFVPSAGADERSRWQAFLYSRYAAVAELNQHHGTSHASIEAVPLPPDLQANPKAATDWDAFCKLGGVGAWTRLRWQEFLAGRYRRIERLRDAHRTGWKRIDQVPVPDVLPATVAAQTDWLQFERQLLPMHRTAHRFSVLLPIASVTGDPYALDQQLALARRIVELEKPAHTVFDVRFFWAFNRVGEARLGMDTQIGAGSRAPELIPDAVVGRAYIGASFVGGAARPQAGDRMLIEC